MKTTNNIGKFLMPENENSSNRCVSPNQLTNGKDFIFTIDETEYFVKHEDVLEYTQNNPKCWRSKTNVSIDSKTGKKKTSVGHFCLIPIDFIMSFAS